ncbi:sensor histidine kinase [Zobellia galactanivorans]|uniref:histidine kinase n=1 Tax=Zobellia galactanivorans (strain DSM 12802 / CCUG 47099 / CIP 106680 / NCIMB 13871 / Dsij) TaxID=63186 RepID=G0L2Y2_ZOBGA|nr:HAMP domain-containing sensor histidine kinase [Zobellia galactanivorans]MBU3025038.1 HAMP domain-containing histidine kinase [Zobellia galactanivorans]CAZ98268.1 Two-component system-Sensor histidine kinase [Zobellia galactanivorans]
MSQNEKTLTPKLIKKLWLAFVLLVLLMGSSYIFITGYFANKYSQETTQRLNADVAHHVIAEKFKDASPFLEDGSVNKPLFGDLMHDMMAVNQSIEVYLLNESGDVLYSVVLDHGDKSSIKTVSLAPIQSFIKNKGERFVLGDDPRNPGEQKIFSAAPYSVDGRNGYMYIVLAGKKFQEISDNLMGQYFAKLGIGATFLTMLFSLVIGLMAIWFLTKNLRLITQTVRKFHDGDLEARIADPQDSDIEVFAKSFNEMADSIVGNMDKMKSVDHLRRELIANVSHDLRTPLAILKGYIETLQIKNDTLSEEQKKEYLQITHDNVDKLSNLVNQLFEYSKLEAEQVTPVKEPFSITELSHDLIAKFRVLAEQKQIELQLDNPQENCMVFADVSLVERALQNLIENALKYTQANGKVTLSLQKKGKNVEINITDTGTGIPVNEQPFIFDRYKQVDKSAKKHGVGLGLAIVKKIMDLHDTTITVLSKPKEGSSFIFNLPAYQI